MTEAAEHARIESLLSSKGMLHRDRICQTSAEQEFDLEYFHLQSLSYTEEENPHGCHLGPQKTYRIRDVARLALQVNGPTGQNLQLRKQRADAELQRSDAKQRIAAEQREAAAALTPVTLSEKLCKEAGVAPWSKLTKTDTLTKFDLESRDLEGLGVAFESKPNPKHPRWAPMRLYKAGDVANALARRRQRAQELQQQRESARAAQMAASRRAARAAAAAIEGAAEHSA